MCAEVPDEGVLERKRLGADGADVGTTPGMRLRVGGEVVCGGKRLVADVAAVGERLGVQLQVRGQSARLCE